LALSFLVSKFNFFILLLFLGSWLKQKNEELLFNNKQLAEINTHLLQQIKKLSQDKEKIEQDSIFQLLLTRKVFFLM